MIAALDYETFYSKDYSIRDLGNYAYTHHPEFDPYMLTVATDAGDTWGGHPLNFDYPVVDKQTWVMANAGFDLSVTEALIEAGKIPSVSAIEVFDVLDLARYLGFPGNLAGAAKHMLGKTLDKGTRDKAKGKHWSEMNPDFQKEMSTYAIRDAQVTLEIWLKYGHLWPEHERQLSRLTREMCARGVPVDIAGIRRDIRSLETLLWKTRTEIPWKIEEDGKGALSKKQMAIECRKNNIEPPKSMAKDSEEFDIWLKQHGEKFPFARAMGAYRSINGQLKRLKAMNVRSIEDDETEGRGWMPFGLKYAGAHTLRDSGDAGVNVQNFSRTAMFEKEMRDLAGVSTEIVVDDKGREKFVEEPDKVFGIDMRGKIMAPEGKVLGVVDLSAIEPCVLNTLAGDEEMIEKLHAGMDPYEAQARITGVYTDPRPLKEVDSDLRQHMKVDVLGMGYGAGPDKVIIIAKTLAGLELSLEEARAAVFRFRSRRFIPNLWDKLESAMRSAAPGDFTIELPSGGEMLYRDVRNFGSLSAVINRGISLMRLKFWGGSLAENVTQRAARDVFMDRVLELAKQMLPPVLRVHDEAVCVLDEATAENDLQRMISVFSTAPAWWQELPVRADGHLCKRYHKG